MRHPAVFATLMVIGLAAVPPAFAGSDPALRLGEACSADSARLSPWSVRFGAEPSTALAGPLRLAYADTQAAAPRRPVPVEYSEGYKTRAKIHKIASYATLPLFVANYFVGQDLYNNPGQSESKRGLHGGLAATTAVLFGINTVTGVWNLWEGRKDTNHRAKRMTHGILMIAADVGFVATGMLAPDTEHEDHTYSSNGSSASTHRTVALTSMGIATVSYLIMLFGGK